MDEMRVWSGGISGGSSRSEPTVSANKADVWTRSVRAEAVCVIREVSSFQRVLCTGFNGVET